MTLFFNHKYSFIKNKKKLKKKNIPHLENWHLIRLLSWEVWQSPNALFDMQYEILSPEKRNKKTEERKRKKKGKNKRNKTKKKESEFQHNPFPNKNKKPQKKWFWHWYQRLVLRGIQPLQAIPQNKQSGRVPILSKIHIKTFYGKKIDQFISWLVFQLTNFISSKMKKMKIRKTYLICRLDIQSFFIHEKFDNLKMPLFTCNLKSCCFWLYSHRLKKQKEKEIELKKKVEEKKKKKKTKKKESIRISTLSLPNKNKKP